MSISFTGWESVSGSKNQLRRRQEPEGGLEYTMYHGTHKTSARNIVISGFKPSSGGLLGPGIYVSRNVKKALCYPHKTKDDEKVVFKLRVRVGKVKKIDCDNHPLQKTWHQHGYDTAWVPRNSKISSIKSGREEDCVWDPKNIRIVEVSHCKDITLNEELITLITHRTGDSGCSIPEAGRCRVCNNVMENPHEVMKCWGCEKLICPFLSLHVCRRAGEVYH